MKIAIIGYGKMGKEIEKIALERKHTIVLKTSNQLDLNTQNLQNADLAIEFSRPDVAVENIKTCFKNNLPIVVGTTGWYQYFEEIKNSCIKEKQALFTATNFSVGVNLFFKINDFVAKLMNEHLDYEPQIEEIHHTQKLDAPSGTAISLAEIILNQIDRKKSWQLNKIEFEEQLLIEAKRIENVPGTHEIKYQSEIDTLELKHTAHSRKGFATGAVLAAEFLLNKKGIFGMNDLLGF